jgi:undecaprenyl-diphosphatase
MALLSALGIAVVGALVKDVVGRPRPTPDLVHVFAAVPETSFPSRHVLIFTTALGFVVFLLYTRAPHTWWRDAGMAVAGALISLVGVSRVYLGHHWPSDVLAAYLLGSLWLILIIALYRTGKEKGWLAPR